MAIVLGPKLGLLNNAAIGENYVDALRPFLQAIDGLLFANCINATTVVPPSSPSNGDAYLLLGSPSGAWSGQANSIAIWDTQVTNSGTNTTNPSWVFYSPNPGWIVYNVATAAFSYWTGSAWTALVTGGSGANFPINTDITALTAITPTSGQTGIVVTATNGSYNAITVTDGIHNSSWTAGGAISAGSLALSGNIIAGQIQASAGVTTNAFANATPGTPISVSQSGGSVNSLVITGTGTTGMSLLGFTTYPTQTTVGAAGGATALPATPTGYLQITISGTEYVIPYYAHV